ncbi:MAG: primosomal protein N' [Bacteroidales bacterium]|nr:primosomal protein N' [Bacteroidales bacterium]MCI7051156.1 primosomal protein N' [Bacteroidales bacterium]
MKIPYFCSQIPIDMIYASILLPLALPGCFSYIVPPRLVARVAVGSRVVVPLGPRRFYTGIVVELQEQNPQPATQLKEVADVADDRPCVLPEQLALWQWMAHYYMCTEGEVMKAALPQGMKLESETWIVRNADFQPDGQQLNATDRAILQLLDAEKGSELKELAKKLGLKNPLPPVKRLLDLGAVVVRESLEQGFRPRTESRVELEAAYFDEAKLHSVLDSLQRAPAQQALLLRYLDLAQAPAALRLQNAGLLLPVTRHALCPPPQTDAALTQLRKKGVLAVRQVEVPRLRPFLDEADGEEDAQPLFRPKPLGEQQQRALQEVEAALQRKQVCLLHGVTSSGKTEVYIHLIEKTLQEGKQVLYLLPEIALTTQITTRLGRVFGRRMAVYHSKFPDAERVELWMRQVGPQPFPLILGVRSAIFLPFQNLGLVIVDEEHETSFKQQEPAPRYQARDTAIVMAARQGAKVVLGTATPALETYANVQKGKYELVEMKERYGHVLLPEIVVENVKELRRKKLMNSPFSPRLLQEVRTALQQGEQAILFQNRRGYAPVVECRTCGWTPRCTRCDVSLTLHRRLGKLVCHYCGAVYDVPQQCPACHGHELRDMGYGTEKIEEAAHRAFPEARIARMDLDTTRSRSAYERLIGSFQRGETNLLIGTQMVTKGLDFDRVRVVGILNADQMLSQADFRAHERAFHLMAQVAGRAGRRSGRGLVVLQTRQPELPLVQQVVRADYAAMFRDEMEERRLFGFPPAVRLINVMVKHRDEQVAARAAEDLAARLRPVFGTGLLGPDRPVVARVQLLFIRKLMVKVPLTLSSRSVRQTLLAARDALLAQPAFKAVRVIFDVDP